MRRRAAAAALAGALAGGGSATRVAAQELCAGQPIRRVVISTSSIFGIEPRPIPRALRRFGNALHWRTSEAVVRRELLFREGEPCRPERLAESARLLRQQDYLRAAHIETLPADTAVDIQVATRDDWTFKPSVRFEPGADPIRGFRLTEENVFGRAVRGSLRVINNGRSAGAELGLLHRQFFGRADAEVTLGSSRAGFVLEQTVLRLFESELDRVAWRESGRQRSDLFDFRSPAYGSIAQPLHVTGVDVGLARRYGHPGALRILGATLAWERLYVTGSPSAKRAEDDSAVTAALAGRHVERRRARAHVVLGARALRFSTSRRLDAVNGPEDVREGVEAGVVFGRSLGVGALQRDWFVAGEAYAGVPLRQRRGLFFARGKAEGRWLREERRWDGVLAWGELLAYAGLTPSARVVVGLSGAGGWHTSTPFQLLLAGPNGIRGFGDNDLPVGRRVVVQAEHRYFAGTLFGAVDFGTAVFVDVGRGWRGDAPFGVDTGTRVAAGVGLRAAVPTGSSLVHRLDVAVPLRRGEGGGGIEVRLGFHQQFGIFQPEPDDVTRSREQVSSVTVFNFPRL